MIEDYHDSANNHNLVNFNIVSVKLNNDLTEAGVRVKGFFFAKDNSTVALTEGWVFKKDISAGEWRFSAIAFSAKGRDRENATAQKDKQDK